MSKQLLQGTDEWLEMRRSYVTASESCIVMGVSTFRTPQELFLEKIGEGKPQLVNYAMHRGIDLEEDARQNFESLIGESVFPSVVFSEKYPWMMASLDGITIDEKIIVELKVPGCKDHSIAKSGRVPEKYYPQLQQQMIVTDLKNCLYYSYNPNDTTDSVLLELSRDEKYCEELIDKTKRFWDCMKSGVLSDEFKSSKKKEYTQRDDIRWRCKVERWNELKILRQQIIDECEGENCEGAGIRVSKHTREGQVDWKSIPELKGIDLEKYRKTSVEYWSIKEIK